MVASFLTTFFFLTRTLVIQMIGSSALFEPHRLSDSFDDAGGLVRLDESASSSCKLLSGWFGWLVQGILAGAAIASLVYKRFTEKPRRSLMVWGFDVSKQAISGSMAHLLNIGFAYFLSTVDGQGDECAWYFVNCA